jgi:hypothetical protein
MGAKGRSLVLTGGRLPDGSTAEGTRGDRKGGGECTCGCGGVGGRPGRWGVPKGTVVPPLAAPPSVSVADSSLSLFFVLFVAASVCRPPVRLDRAATVERHAC